MTQVDMNNLPLQMVAPPQVVAPQIFQVTNAPQQSGTQIPAGTQMVQIATDRGPMMVPVYQPQAQGSMQMTQTSASVATTVPTSNTRAARPFVRGRVDAQFCVQIERQRKMMAQMRVTLLTVNAREAWNINEENSYQRMLEQDEESEMFHNFGYETDMSDGTPEPLAENERIVGMQEFRNARARREALAQDPFGLYWTSLLDSGASHSTWCNDGIVHGIHQAPLPMHMFTNTGDRLVDEMGYVDVCPFPIYYDGEGSANVNSMSELVKHGYRITMDTDVDNAMIVHCGGGKQMRFVMKKGVYVFENPDGPRERGADETSLRARDNQPLNEINQPYFSAYQKTGYSADQVMMPTVRKNMEGFTRKQVQAAQDVRSAMHIVGAPDERRLKQAIRAGLFKNCTITEEAIDHAQAIYGKDTSTLKGKSTRKTPKKVIDDWIAIPRELTEHNELLELFVDHMFVNNAIFLTCIDGTVKFRMCKAVPNTSANEMLNGLDSFLRTYNHGGFDIVKINCDQAFIPITEEMQDEMNIVVDPTTPGGHEPTAERNNRTIKERMRVAHARMPYSAIPRVMTEALGERVAETLNYFPAKNGISDHYSTMQIVEHRNVDFKRDCVAEFGAYVHGKGGESKNTMEPRTIEAVYMRPTKLLRAGHKLLNLNSRKVITRPQVVVLPVTDQVIARVNAWANEEGVYSLKFFDKNGDEETFQDGDQIAGVDDTQQGYAEEAFDPDYQDEEEEELKRDANLQGRFDDIDYDEEVDLIMDAIDEVYDDEEVAQLFGDDEDEDDVPSLRYQAINADEDDDDSDDEDFDFETPIGQTVPEVAIEDDGDELTADEHAAELDEIINDVVEEEINFYSPRKTRSGRTYAQVVTGIQHSSRSEPVEDTSTRSAKKKKNNGRCNTRRKHRQKILKSKLKLAIKRKKISRSDLEKSKEAIHNLQFRQTGDNWFDYTDEEATLIARCMMQIRDKFDTQKGMQFIQQYYLNKGLKIFGDEGRAAVDKELHQLLKRECFAPVDVSELSQLQIKRAQEAMMLLAEKLFTQEKKGRLVFRGDGTREWLSREDTASPTASLEGIELTCTVDAYERRDMMSMDVPNAFIQTFMPEPDDINERVVMKITGSLVDILINMEPQYRKFVVLENGKRVIYTVVLRAIYGMLESSLMWYNQFRGDLEGIGFEFNAYDPCIANRVVNGKQQTIRFHVDDLLSSHVDPKVNDEFAVWLNDKYGSIKPCTIVRGKLHRYLGMMLDFTVDGKVKFRMDEYVERMIDEFPVKFDETVTQETPAANDLLEAGRGELLSDDLRETFHSYVARGYSFQNALVWIFIQRFRY
jgi:hypothetical protein